MDTSNSDRVGGVCRLESFLSLGRNFGRFWVLERIAEGGFGEIYEAIDARTSRRCALKIPHFDDRIITAQFFREHEIVRELDHPNVVPVLHAELIYGIPTLTYPLGVCSIADLLEDGLRISQAFDFGAQMLDGLAHIHASGFLHCDLKPGNLIVFSGERIGISDFGLARALGEEGAHTTSGTAEYMAPEHLDGCVSTASDVFEAALVIVEMFAGELPDNGVEIEVGRYLPGEPWARSVAPVLERALSVDPERRFRDGAAFAHAFDLAVRRRAVA